MIFLGIILLIVGVLYIVLPKKTLSFGRKYLFRDNKEANAGALFFTRMMGVFVVILAVYAIYISR